MRFFNTDKTNQAQRLGRQGPVNKNTGSSAQQNRRPSAHEVLPEKNAFFDPKALKSKDSTEIVHMLNEGILHLNFLPGTKDQNHNNDEFICDLTSTLGKACSVPPGENLNKILATLKGSAFFNSKIPSLLDRFQESKALNDQLSQQRFIEHLIEIFMKYLTHLPSSYADLPYTQLKAALDQSSVQNKEELQTRLDEFKQARNDVIRGERQRHGKRFVNRAGEKPPNDFRDIPICPETKEITTQERPFLRKNISRGRYENAEHYLDVQFRLLREDFLEPLREGIREIVLKIPRHERKQLIKYYRSVKIVGKEFTWSGIIHKVHIDISGLDTSTWAHSKRFLFGSFLCLSNDNFKTMLFATVSDCDAKKVKEGRIDIRFTENQDVYGIESRNCVYQMVESPAYFEAYRYVLKGLQELDETTLPFKKYLVECSADVDPPEYLRPDESEEPVYYDLGKALRVLNKSNTTAPVPVLNLEAWPSVAALPLNSSQLEALKTAITTEFSVIQGPPGTGKTYVGAKIVHCLLENRSVWDPLRDTPMLMVCYTNHALDQFLEKVLEFLPSRNIIRVGGRCKSDKLENCNLKKFTYRYRMNAKREEVNERLRQNDKEMKISKQLLEKADVQLLEFEDVEQLINPAHLQQLCNAKFPSKVANESRTPSNTFTLWLCNNKEMGCNQTAKASTLEKHAENEENELFYHETLFTEPQDDRERSLEELLAAVNVSNDEAKPDLPPKMGISEQRKLNKNSYERGLPCDLSDEQKDTFLRQQMEFNVLEDDFQLKYSNFEHTALIEGANIIQRTEHPEAEGRSSDGHVDEKREVVEETIAIEREADLIQQQRWIQGDEDLLLPISKETDVLIREEQNKRGTNEENDEQYWTLETHNEKGKSHLWMPNVDENCEEDAKLKDEETAGTFSSKKKKKRKKKRKKTNVPLTEDIYSIQDDLSNREVMSTEEVTSSLITGDLIREEQNKKGTNEENDDEYWTFETQKKKGKSHLWMPNVDGNSKEDGKLNDEETGGTVSSKKRKKTKKKRKKTKVPLTEDICSIQGDLSNREMMSTEEVMGIQNIWNLSQSDRLRLYLFWIENYREHYRVEIYQAEQAYEQLREELQEVQFEEEEQVMRQATVVGMTTTGAARYHSVLQRIAPKIVVIEEAAEVMEAHIITSLSHNTKHTILIGDHKQLRPKATVYELARKYNLEVSLFERMVLNSMDCKRLSIQHRMRPEIATLTKRIYDHEIEDHDSVCDFPAISGLCHSLFFIDHCQPEKLIEGLQSYSNHHEAEFLVALCHYLLLQGYERKQITILTMYTGQLLLLQEKMPRQTFEGVKVCAVDNFQGEENDIILLSLVRSNSEGRIGFLGESNRICVALSRARKGFYCIGNFSLLKSQCKLWKEICDDLKTKEAIGDNLQLVCRRHSNVTNVRWARELRQCELRGCTMPCGDRLECGHACNELCHASDVFHAEGRCSKPCFNSCPSGHQCPYRCHYPRECPACMFLVFKTLACGHVLPFRCWIDPVWSGFICEKMVVKILPCGHDKPMKCFENPNIYSYCTNSCTNVLDCGHTCSRRCKEKCQCNTKIEIQLPCNHRKIVLCREKKNSIKCNEKCERTLNCGHACSGMCHEECTTKLCKIDVLKTLLCGHQKIVRCFQDPQTVFCFSPCQRQLNCGHSCLSPCGRLCQEVPCKELCRKKCPRGHPCQRQCHFGSSCYECTVLVNAKFPTCGHNVKVPCFINPAKLTCNKPCERLRVCGHPCKDICGIDCDTRPCQTPVTRVLSCKHVVALACQGNTETFICKTKVDVPLPCGHTTSLECHVAKARYNDVLCMEKVGNESRCAHKVTLPQYCFHEKVEITLFCGHKKFTTSSRKQEQFQSGRCNAKVKRILSCGHEKEMQCSDNADRVFCDEPCERVLPCKHPCGKRCGDDCASFRCAVGVKKVLSCGRHDVSCFCYEDVSQRICSDPCTRSLPCGHQQIVRCSQDPPTVFCSSPCQRQLICGHSCPSPCGRLCQEVPCKELCRKKCPRGHPCQRQCHFGSSCYECTVLVNAKFPTCGHNVKVPCFINPAKLTCNKPCERLRVCGHPCKDICGIDCDTRPCQTPVTRVLSCKHVVALACQGNTETFICKTKVDVPLPCGHTTSLECHVAKARYNDVLCMEKVGNESRCAHKVTLPQYCFHEKVEITLFCGHKKFTTSSRKQEQFQSGRCNTKVKRRLPCGHEKEMQCSDNADRAFCDEPCERILPCKHPCGNRCGDDCASFRCVVGVKKVLSCGRHDVSCFCSEDVSQRICSDPCTRSLPCGHQCPGKCHERCSDYKCQMLVVKNLPCAGNHSLKMLCNDDPSIVKCRARCDRKLECGHRCPGVCSQACGAIICRRKVVKEYGCGHKQRVRCFESKTAICKVPCPRRERCTHKCKGLCGEPCSKYPCQVPLVKTLPCGHKVEMPCSLSIDDVECPVSCQVKLPCGHECSATCGECKQRGSHEICQSPCNRVLVCSHRCQEMCSRPCPPCARKCSRRCPHTKYSQQCSQPCRPCIKPCDWNCPHYQCNNPCGEECDRPRCDAPCPKKLPCRHPCIGLCGENCPTLCAICHAKKLSSMIGQGNFKATEATRYLQLLDCGHIVKVQEMDEWMLRDVGDNVSQIQCPRCSIPITFSYRYGNIVKRTLRNMENVKNQIREIGNETTRFTRELLKKLHHPPKGILTLAGRLSSHSDSKELDNVKMHDIPFVFTLRNSLLIIHQIEKAYLILQAVEKCQDQLQVTDHSRTIKYALEKISDYLTTPQFDLGTLSQLYEHTRTFTLFASILEAQCQAITSCRSFSSIGVLRLKSAQEKFELFMQGKIKVLQNEWLEKIAASLRNEVDLPPLLPEDQKEFKKFPSYNTRVWKLCKLHGQVYFTTSFMREGEDVTEISGCRQCDGTDDTDENTG